MIAPSTNEANEALESFDPAGIDFLFCRGDMPGEFLSKTRFENRPEDSRFDGSAEEGSRLIFKSPAYTLVWEISAFAHAHAHAHAHEHTDAHRDLLFTPTRISTHNCAHAHVNLRAHMANAITGFRLHAENVGRKCWVNRSSGCSRHGVSYFWRSPITTWTSTRYPASFKSEGACENRERKIYVRIFAYSGKVNICAGFARRNASQKPNLRT